MFTDPNKDTDTIWYDGTPPSVHEATDRHPRQSASCSPYTKHCGPTSEAETSVNARATPAGSAARRSAHLVRRHPHPGGEDIDGLVSPKMPCPDEDGSKLVSPPNALVLV
ncbi:unnamed protein product [Cyclocybe aegerita]|uniref:Uncharacterized protein n=1 Tax=Cyclocybe aegerita TaxID=1973307 RepID=A0A8S0X2V9_CYCAE|nr:unnamed protein product [Cyclocybe aegerita]